MLGGDIVERKELTVKNADKFIEVHIKGAPWLVNLDYVEQISKDGNRAMIYLAFNIPDAVEQDSMSIDESYEWLRDRIWGQL